jgi:transcriptional regulator with XRE-family HTH domain
MKVNELIRSKRKEKNMTQQELADLLFVSSKTISKWETGRGLPELASINKLSEILEITADEMMGSVNESSEEKSTGIDLGIKNAIIMSTVIMVIGVVLFSLASFYLYRNDNYIIFYMLSGISILGSISIYFILENNRSLKIGYRRKDNINEERKLILKIWTGLLATAPIIQYMTYFRETFETDEMLIVIAIEYIIGSIVLIILYRFLIRK